MTNKIIVFTLTLMILTMFFVAGCLKMTETETKPSDEQGVVDYEQQETGDETINNLSGDISDLDVMDDDLDTQDLDNLAQDLDNLDW